MKKSKKYLKQQNKMAKNVKKIMEGMLPLMILTMSAKSMFGILDRATFVEPDNYRMVDQ